MNATVTKVTEEKVNAIYKLVEKAVKALVDPSALHERVHHEPEVQAPEEPPREAHGAKIRSDVIGVCKARFDSHLMDHPDQLDNLMRLVDRELASRAFGLSYMRVNELKQIRSYLQRKGKV